jgi:hypothetical protein
MSQRSASAGMGAASRGASFVSPSNSALVMRISETPVTICGSSDSGSLALMMTTSAGAS